MRKIGQNQFVECPSCTAFVVARVFRPGDFLSRHPKFPASEEAGYSSGDDHR
jgi:hypothetical protein